LTVVVDATTELNAVCTSEALQLAAVIVCAFAIIGNNVQTASKISFFIVTTTNFFIIY
jgi:hypothetical protein